MYLTFYPLFDVHSKDLNKVNQLWSLKYNDIVDQNIKLRNIGDR